MKAASHLQSQQGQAQLLSAMVLSTVMLSIAIYAIDSGKNIGKQSTTGRRRSEMRNALDGAIDRIRDLYVSQAGCDPALLNRLVNRLNTDGTLNSGTATGTRSLAVMSGTRTYTVQIGPVLPGYWDTSDTTYDRKDGVSGTAANTKSPAILYAFPTPIPTSLGTGSTEDTTVEVWTSTGTAGTGIANPSVAVRTPNLRMTRHAVLLNSCTYPCNFYGNDILAGGTAGPPCSLRANRGVGYARIRYAAATSTFLPSHPGRSAVWGPSSGLKCLGDRLLGDVNIPDPNPLPSPSPVPSPTRYYRDVSDLWVLRNYVQTGSGSYWNRTLLQGDGTKAGCGDLNLDGVISDADLGILEKYLRGYLYWIPPIWGSATNP